WKTSLSVALLLAVGTTLSAQSDPQKTKVFTLEEAVEFALKNYPALRASFERVRAAEAGVGVARTSYLPRTDLLWQSNRATDNNITGLTIPNSVIAPITGPVPLSPSNRSAWGSASGLLFSWEPLDFGYRGARVDAARAAQNRAAAEASLTRLDVSVGTVNAYLTLLAAEQTVRAAQADLRRLEPLRASATRPRPRRAIARACARPFVLPEAVSAIGGDGARERRRCHRKIPWGHGRAGTGPRELGRRAECHVPGIRYFFHQVEESGGNGERTRRRGALRSGASGFDGTTSKSASLARRRPQSRREHAARTRRRTHYRDAGTRALSSGPRDARRCCRLTKLSR